VKRYLAPLLITGILISAHLSFGILEGYSRTGTAILVAIAAEIIMSRLTFGNWPHPASAYITGISVGILVRTPIAWLYVLCSYLAITSKYALRVRGRHLWNPSNLGICILLFLIPESIAPLSLEWGNYLWVPCIIMVVGFGILSALGRLHITLTYVLAFTVLSLLRSAVTGRPIEAELGLLTAPSYLLFMFFMITDPKTTPRTRARQIAVTIAVALVETVLRLCENAHAPYYALFLVFPAANLLEIWWDGRIAAQSASSAETSR
jgi:Na+-translocating ferredoxin:NAD+ oxidoreductase RnfD subunit